tara:strand:- start:140 stop:2569 length:2430 start_codon:yes stop_codon:yes gene_type:complete
VGYFRQNTLGRYGQAQQPTVTSYTFPASVGGVNAVDSLMMMPPQDCIYTYNLMPSEYGMRLRQGYREWATGCVESPQRAQNVDVRSIIPFESNRQDVANDRLFAITAEGIWDTTLFNTTSPNQEVVFTQTSDPAGYGVWCEFTGDAAGVGLRGHYMFYADGLNGIWQYEEATDSWSQPPSGVGLTDWYYLDPSDGTTAIAFPVDNVAFVMVFKQRIWVILEDEDDAWYLPVASVTGELKKFTFGSKMPHGGNLMALYNWTVDGGDGVDDMMVAVSRGGDVIVYQGEDPEITPDGSSVGPWSTRGAWFIGEIPATRRLAIDYGPDLYMLSTFGLTSLNDLLQGNPLTGQTPSRKINRFLRADVENGKDSSAWQLVSHPGDGFLQIITPKPAQTPYVQYNMNMQTGAWGFWEGVPIFSGDSWNGNYMMGGPEGVVYINDGTLDGVEIDKANFFQDVPNPAPSAEWSVPVPLDFRCDGSQVAETAYQIDMTQALSVGTNYEVFYRITANPLINLFQNVQAVFPGAEWTVPLANEFNCSGAQFAETAYETTLVSALEVGVRYQITFKTKDYTAGSFKFKVGTEDVISYSNGNGSWSAEITPAAPISTVSMVGDSNFQGTFYDVIIGYYDGSGQHSLKVGNDTVVLPSIGSGAFSAVFNATAAETQMSLIGDEDFTGTFSEVSLRVQNFAGQSIEFRTLTSFQAPAGHSNFTRVGFVRTIGVLAGAAALNARAVYDYAIEDAASPPIQVPAAGDNIWDSAVWDRDLWDFTLEGKSFPLGSLGMGRTFAVSMTGNANTRINIVGWDILFTTGGYL